MAFSWLEFRDLRYRLVRFPFFILCRSFGSPHNCIRLRILSLQQSTNNIFCCIWSSCRYKRFFPYIPNSLAASSISWLQRIPCNRGCRRSHQWLHSRGMFLHCIWDSKDKYGRFVCFARMKTSWALSWSVSWRFWMGWKECFVDWICGDLLVWWLLQVAYHKDLIFLSFKCSWPLIKGVLLNETSVFAERVIFLAPARPL